MDESLALLAKRAGRRLDHSRLAYDRINHWQKLAQVVPINVTPNRIHRYEYVVNGSCVKIFKFISVVDASFFAKSSHLCMVLVGATHRVTGWIWKPPLLRSNLYRYLREMEHKLWVRQRGLFTPDQDEADDYDVFYHAHYMPADRCHGNQTGTWSAAESTLAKIKRRRIDYRYEWYQIYAEPQYSSDDYELQ